MKIILGILAWIVLSFAGALFAGAFIYAGMGDDHQTEEKHDETHHHLL